MTHGRVEFADRKAAENMCSESMELTCGLGVSGIDCSFLQVYGLLTIVLLGLGSE